MKRPAGKYVDPSAVIGFRPRFLQGAIPWVLDIEQSDSQFDLPEFVYVGPFASIGIGARIGNGCVVDAYCKIDPYAQFGDDSLLLYRGTIGIQASVGQRCVVGGSVSENTIVEDDCTSFGKLIHTHWDSNSSWDYRKNEEPSPIVRKHSFVGHDARVIGGIEIGPFAYVCAGSTVTRSVPPYHIAHGTNKVVHFSKWEGALSNNPIFQLTE